MYNEITCCRVCKNQTFKTVIDLGNQALTGVFPLPGEDDIFTPVKMVQCCNPECELMQLAHDYDMSYLYGDNYGYRSGLNFSMVSHLREIVQEVISLVELNEGDWVVDIGSNDCTLLNHYSSFVTKQIFRLGVDPTGEKFKEFYPENVKLIPEFFSKEAVRREMWDSKAKIITSIAMFYDLKDPIDFCKQIAQLLSFKGLWVFEQAYTKQSIITNGFDVACAEHLMFYNLKQVKHILGKAGLRIYDVSFNDANGGSFRVTACLENSNWGEENNEKIKQIISDEEKFYSNPEIFSDFKNRVEEQKKKVLKFLEKLKEQGRHAIGLGASTKGNVLLQYFGIDQNLVPFIAEVNQFKFGRECPGTRIPIISELQADRIDPLVYLVLPWHFKNSFLSRMSGFMKSGGCLLFPLPTARVYKHMDPDSNEIVCIDL